jgi:hypothetical protein
LILSDGAWTCNAPLRLLGHADIHTTVRHHGHLEHGRLRDAALRAEAAVWRVTKDVTISLSARIRDIRPVHAKTPPGAGFS